jgi:GDP-mannose 6-dehydrogenase
VAVLGLAFKAGTDDLRESPMVNLVDQLWREGYEVRVHDPDVVLDEMVGANRAYVERQLPQIASVLVPDLAEALAGAELVVVGQRRPEFARAVTELRDAIVLDLVRLDAAREPATAARYIGLSW